MKKTRVVNIRKEPCDVYIGRAGASHDGYFGNPVRLVNYHNSAERRRCIEQFRTYFFNRLEKDPEFKRRVLELRGKTLGCFCAPLPCHGDVIAEFVDSSAEL